MNKKSNTIGERLRQKRTSLELEIKDASDEIQAPKKFLEAFENDDYSAFPAKVYALGFFKKYVKFLNFEEDSAQQIIKEFSQEWEIAAFKKRGDIKKIPEIRENVFILTPGKTAALIGLVAILVVVGYFGYQMRFLGSPKLIVQSPPENYLSENNFIEISGIASKNADLTINGRTIYIDENGFFKDNLNLALGLNTLEFKAVNKFRKETTIIRHVLVK